MDGCTENPSEKGYFVMASQPDRATQLKTTLS